MTSKHHNLASSVFMIVLSTYILNKMRKLAANILEDFVINIVFPGVVLPLNERLNRLKLS